MIKGLKKDHNMISDLIFTQFQIIQSCLIDTFDTYIELFSIHSKSSKLLDCVYIKQEFKKINISQLYYLTSTINNNSIGSFNSFHNSNSYKQDFNNEIPSLLKGLNTSTQPIFVKALSVLERIHKDYANTHYSPLYNLDIIINLHHDYYNIFTRFNKIIELFSSFLERSASTTDFSYNTGASFSSDIMIVGFNEYDVAYEELMEELYVLDDCLKDLKEDIRKNTPCFEEFCQMIKKQKGTLKGSFDEIFEMFKNERKEKLGLDKRTVFGVC